MSGGISKNYIDSIITSVIFIILALVNIFNPRLYVSIVLYKHISIILIFLSFITILITAVIITRKNTLNTNTTTPSENFMMRDNLLLMETEFEMGKTMSIQDNKVEKCDETETFIAKNLPLWVEK